VVKYNRRREFSAGADLFCSDTIQIVYDTNHWVAMAFVENEAYVANSLGNNISPLVSEQLKELYHHRVSATGSLAVNLVQCSQ